MKSQGHFFSPFETTTQDNRIFTKDYDGFAKVRKVIVSRSWDPLSYNEQSSSQFIKKVNIEYTFQENLVHQHIVKNLNFEYKNRQVIMTQSLSFLHELPLQYLNFEKRMRIFYGVCLGLKHLHHNRICHGSLSPMSISIAVEKKVPKSKINLFASAVKFQNKESERDSSQIKSNSYSSPEIKRGMMYGIKSDIYSLGLILNYILYETLQNVWENQKQIQIQVPSETPDWLLELLKSMLQYEHKKRYLIDQVLDVVKVSLKCLQVLSKHIPLGNKKLKLNKKNSSKIKSLQQQKKQLTGV